AKSFAPGSRRGPRKVVSMATSGASSSPSQSKDPPRILIVRLSSMGDVVHARPAAAALRQAFPNATIGWLIEERWAELLCTLPTPRSGARSPQRPLVDIIHTVNLKRWR